MCRTAKQSHAGLHVRRDVLLASRGGGHRGSREPGSLFLGGRHPGVTTGLPASKDSAHKSRENTCYAKGRRELSIAGAAEEKGKNRFWLTRVS